MSQTTSVQRAGQRETENDPRSSNTGVQSSQNHTGEGPSSHHASGGHDWFEFRGYGRAPKAEWQELRELLEGRRAEAEQNGGPVVAELPEGDKVAVRPRGFAKGDGSFPWVVEWRGGVLAFSDQSERDDETPAYLAQYTSLPCMAYGAQTLLDDTLELMQSVGLYTEYTKRATRMDLCVDVAGLGIEPFVKGFDERRFVAKCKSMDAPIINGGRNNVRFGSKGKGSVQFEVYNKLLEVFRKPGPKVPYMIERWGGELPEQAIRAEVRIFGGYRINKEYGIVTAQDSISHSHNLAKYFANDWLRFTDQINDRESKHQGRLTTSSDWQTIQKGLGEAFMKTERNWEKRPKRLASDVEGLQRQAWGCLRAQFAYLHPQGTAEEWDRFVLSRHQDLRQENWEKIQDLQELHAAAEAFGQVQDPFSVGIPF